jgi:hypothetical protein
MLKEKPLQVKAATGRLRWQQCITNRKAVEQFLAGIDIIWKKLYQLPVAVGFSKPFLLHAVFRRTAEREVGS